MFINTIVDEINLTDSEVSKALNRLLDDNRELSIPEINKVIKLIKKYLLL